MTIKLSSEQYLRLSTVCSIPAEYLSVQPDTAKTPYHLHLDKDNFKDISECLNRTICAYVSLLEDIGIQVSLQDIESP